MSVKVGRGWRQAHRHRDAMVEPFERSRKHGHRPKYVPSLKGQAHCPLGAPLIWAVAPVRIRSIWLNTDGTQLE